MEIRLDHVVIAVSDWERSNAFYRDVLGVALVELDKGRFAYRFGTQQLNVHGPGSEPYPVARERVRPANSYLCFAWSGKTEDAVQHLRRHGVEVEEGAGAAPGRAGRRNERLLPRPGRLAAGAHRLLGSCGGLVFVTLGIYEPGSATSPASSSASAEDAVAPHR